MLSNKIQYNKVLLANIGVETAESGSGVALGKIENQRFEMREAQNS